MMLSTHDRNTLTVRGRVDVGAVPDLRRVLRDALTDGSLDPLVVDCAGLELVDTAGLGALLAAHHHAVRLGRSLKLVRVAPPLLRLLTVTRLARVLDVQVDVAA